MAGKVPVAAMVGNGVNRVALTVRRTLPVYLKQRTLSDRPSWSVWCQTRKWRIQVTQRKTARRRLFNSNLMIVDQAANNADFDSAERP
jgi:hypothetical protein